MKINELIASSARITSYNSSTDKYTEGHYASDYVFSNKKIGQVLQYNKTVLYKPESSVIEIGIYFRAVTEKGKSGHFCQIALRGIEMEEKDISEVFSHLRRKNNGKYAQYSDDELLNIIARGDNVYYGKYVIQSRNRPNKFLVMKPTISGDTDVRVRCSCASFIFDVAWYNADHKCLIGSRPPQSRKFKLNKDATPNRNIYRTPGLCKHLMLALSLLMKDGFIKGGSDKFNKQGASMLKRSSSMDRLTVNEANTLVRNALNQAKAQVRYSRQMWGGKQAQVPSSIANTNIGTYWDREAIPKNLQNLSNTSEVHRVTREASYQAEDIDTSKVVNPRRFSKQTQNLLAWVKNRRQGFNPNK